MLPLVQTGEVRAARERKRFIQISNETTVLIKIQL